MTVGAMRNRITVQQPVTTPDGIGGSTTAWSTFASMWAQITPTRIRQVTQGEGLEYRVTHKVLVRDAEGSGVLAGMRISYEGRVLQIHGVMNVAERNHFIQFLCEEGTAS